MEPKILKLIIAGDCSVGKTSLINRYTNQTFKEKYVATIGMDFSSQDIELDGKEYCLQIWDTAGLEKYRSLVSNLFKKCAGALLVYEIGNKESFQNIPNFIKTCKENSPEEVVMVLVGNKSDLEERQVSTEEGQKLAEENGMLFLETSAKTGENVKELLEESAKEIYKKMKENTYDTQILERDSIKIETKEKEEEEEKEEKVNGKKNPVVIVNEKNKVKINK